MCDVPCVTALQCWVIMRVIRKVWWHSSKGIVKKRICIYTNQTLKPKARHIDNLLITGCTLGCHRDNPRCNQWRKYCQYDDFLCSVVLQDLILHLKIKTRSPRSQWDNQQPILLYSLYSSLSWQVTRFWWLIIQSSRPGLPLSFQFISASAAVAATTFVCTIRWLVE